MAGYLGNRTSGLAVLKRSGARGLTRAFEYIRENHLITMPAFTDRIANIPFV